MLRSSYTLEILNEILNISKKSEMQGYMKSQIPHDIRTVMKTLNINPKILKTVFCPNCYSSYSVDKVPMVCTFHPLHKNQKCGRNLLSSTYKLCPNVNIFANSSLIDWLEEFLKRQGIEDLLDTHLEENSPPSIMRSIWDSPRWKEYKDTNGFQFTSNSGNLVFSLSVDWFNPHEKTTRRSISLGVITMLCMNLPIQFRNLQENIYVAGIIPGPNEPKLELLNEILKPLVEDLLRLWDGHFFHQTYREPFKGRLIKALVGVIVCDLPAARKLLGMAGHSSKNHFCSLCYASRETCNLASLQAIPHRSGSLLRRKAYQWKNAKTVKEKERIFSKYGVRYTILLELPYVDLTKIIVIEPMHNICLGLLKHHGLNLLGLNKVKKNTNRTSIRSTEETQESNEEITENSFENDSSGVELEADNPLNPIESVEFSLSSLNTLHMTTSNSIPDRSKHWQEFKSIPLRLPQKTTRAARDPVDEVKSTIFSNNANVKLLQEIIPEVSLPSWVGRIPENIGTRSVGSLKANE
ncbi:hypothetical protein O181_049737 [Austropuccinia psidii MF-1]|uniref:Transposase domain-containing protein n=1 Tax=Austropuccinia psidii MF-1 TaxID=1389203 RepID=A0A9Q3DXK5_9BASI|nr:hypothetical protein [Austropuccinia psidii MF-1]